VAYWQRLHRAAGVALPLDFESGRELLASTRHLTCELTPQETQALLYHSPRAYHTQIHYLPLTALAHSIVTWTDQDAALSELARHGREALCEEIDHSRTVGWFTSLYPVLLDLSSLNPQAQPGTWLKLVKEQLRAIPQHGLGYGLLRYLCGDAAIVEQ